ncbi:MAG: CDP-diacylglycerol--glycerol-3-phosphate 3-phosphatidyltransferase [Acidimicrobiia bacterium]|nr:CDP-diacylglycerol--glycerol-3-phosphate 3-phosphatidyltransferase [Acidimicrobiia bacterium]
MSWPDRIAYLRIALVPVIMALILYATDGGPGYVVALGVFIVAAVSDFLDGYLARRWDIATVLGGFLDSVADKLLVLGALTALVKVGRAWTWALFIIVARELAVMGLRGVAALGKEGVPPSIWGKAKAWVQFTAIGLAMVRLSDQWGPLYLDEYFMILAVVVTLLSGYEYFVRYQRVFRLERNSV